jgi:hypothetical protein
LDGGGSKKMSALDAAAKLLAETGDAMNCQNLIKGMSSFVGSRFQVERAGKLEGMLHFRFSSREPERREERLPLSPFPQSRARTLS